MKKFTGRKAVCWGALLGSAALLAIPAAVVAQVADTPNPAVSASTAKADELSDIVVTATRREKSAQDVGIALTVFSQKSLRDLAITSTEELSAATPGLQLTPAGGSPIVGLLSIRGVAQNDFAGHIEAPNAFYVDDVYQPSISSSVQQLYDVQRVEVLKGPQGTLFGRNATGGLVHIITNKPTNELSGYGQVSYGNYNEWRGEGGVTVPLGDKISTRFSFLRDVRDGFYQNDIGPALNQDDTVAFRGQLKLTASEQLKLLFIAGIYRIKPVTTGGSYPTGGTQDANGLGVPLPPGSPTGYGYVDADGNPFTGSYNDPGFLKRTQKDISGKIEYQMGDLLLTSLSSYSTLINQYREDNDLSPAAVTLFYQNADADYFTQELRLGKSKGQFRWTAGLYYLNTSGIYYQAYELQAAATLSAANYSLKTQSWSVFAQGDYDLSDKLTVIAGARYTHDSKQYEYLAKCTGPACGVFILPNTIGSSGGYKDRHNEGGVSGRFEFDYKIAPGVLGYASYNRGYKAFNYNAGFAGQAPIALARFKGETLNALEIGQKGDFLDRKLRLNAALYYYDYKNYQAFDQRGLNFTLYNTDATIYGIDADLTIRPGMGLTLGAGATYLHTKVENVPLTTGNVSREAPQSPKYTLNFSAIKEMSVEAAKVRLTLSGTYTDKLYSQLTNAEATLIPGNWVANGRISVGDKSERFELSFFAKNIFNEYRQNYAFDITGPGFGMIKRDYAAPRQIGIEGRTKF